MSQHEIPRAVLSEHLQERMQDRRLISAVFTTFRFEPGFFEAEVLPVFFDIPLSHAAAIKLVQLEDTLRALPGSIAVYYDQHGLVASSGGAKLDVRRYPIKHRTGLFHPKNVLALVEGPATDGGPRPRALLVAAMSANLTRAGWWENVEVAHVEEIAEGAHTTLQGPLLDFIDDLIRDAEGRRPNVSLRAKHEALHTIRDFLVRHTSQRERRSAKGRLHPHFDGARSSLGEFMESVAGRALNGLCLEVISPYFDGGELSRPLADLRARFGPSEVRVFLPRNERGEAHCSEALFDAIHAQPGVSWGRLPRDLLRLGKGDDVKERSVHAKVYRFFDPKRGGREFIYVGSANLTTPGCRPGGRGGNLESGFLVEVTGASRPGWWMTTDTHRPPLFIHHEEGEGTATSVGTALVLRYSWDTHEGAALWNDAKPCPALTVRRGGVALFGCSALPPRVWAPLDREANEALRGALASTSLLEVVDEHGELAYVLVQEEGMHGRPSLLLELSAAEILRYWSLLTPEQRAVFIEERARGSGEDEVIAPSFAPPPAESTLFDRFAGIFHAFSCLETHVREALAEDRAREADYRLFGKKYDSLGTLLDRAQKDHDINEGDRVERYVLFLCAKQLLREIGREFPVYWHDHSAAVMALDAAIARGLEGRDALTPSPEFLDWFERWFLQRARGLGEESAP